MFDFIIKLIPNSTIRKYVGSIVRHGLTYLAGALAVIEFEGVKELAEFLLANMDGLSAVLTTVLMGVIGLLMSFVEKKGK